MLLAQVHKSFVCNGFFAQNKPTLPPTPPSPSEGCGQLFVWVRLRTTNFCLLRSLSWAIFLNLSFAAQKSYLISTNCTLDWQPKDFCKPGKTKKKIIGNQPTQPLTSLYFTLGKHECKVLAELCFAKLLRNVWAFSFCADTNVWQMQKNFQSKGWFKLKLYIFKWSFLNYGVSAVSSQNSLLLYYSIFEWVIIYSKPIKESNTVISQKSLHK